MEVITADYIKFLQKRFHEAERYNRENTINNAIAEIDFLLKNGCIYLKNTQNALTIPLGGKMELGYYTYRYANTGVIYNYKPITVIHSSDTDLSLKKLQEYYTIAIRSEFVKEFLDRIISHYKECGFDIDILSGGYTRVGMVCTYEDDLIRISWDNSHSDDHKPDSK